MSGSEDARSVALGPGLGPVQSLTNFLNHRQEHTFWANPWSLPNRLCLALDRMRGRLAFHPAKRWHDLVPVAVARDQLRRLGDGPLEQPTAKPRCFANMG